MTPEHPAQDPSPEQGIEGDTEEHAQVRRLLAAAARATPAAPAPPEVVSRLDAALAELQATEHPSGAPDDQLTRRRRRRWPQVLAAAAALVVVGAGVGTLGGVLDGGFVGSGDSSSTTASGPEESRSGGGAGLGPSASAPTEARTFQAPEGTPQTQPPGQQLLIERPTSRLPRMQLGSARADAQRIYERVVLTQGEQGAPSPPSSTGAPAARCSLPPVEAGETLVAVRFGASRASLLVGPPHAGRRDADVYTCADPGTPVLATTVSVP